jgi:DNA invertase Pin-like site-specific DNA recombinase
MTGAFVEFERSMIRQRVRAGLSVIKAKIERDGKFVSKAGKVWKRLGRPGAEADKLDRARQELATSDPRSFPAGNGHFTGGKIDLASSLAGLA